ncbi:hypothetical protein M407DRAFT_20836 [Tulasnella calospora MUT 4182]|uniref:Uncharacterized protein n=1 Tax=Tulasnella calospora MUT 4182 TaxID=1051891 RepID=A0A0C3QR40_9AGAM|nr:hypothetical protein M407DRAFT_20836 [Tulasnella calospora MUT 4182]
MVSDQDLIDFIARQRHLLNDERESDLERSSLVLTSCSPKLLELKGLALNNLGVVSNALNRPGDIARIEESSTSQRTGKKKGSSAEGSGSDKAIEGVIYKITDTRAILAVDQAKDSNSDDIDLPEKCRLVKLANTVTYDR